MLGRVAEIKIEKEKEKEREGGEGTVKLVVWWPWEAVMVALASY